MSKMTKSHWVTDGANMRLTLPFAKVDEERRLVSGYATLDNLDSQGDVVLSEASADAFARARGNIREMHQPIAAGHLVDFREDEYYDTETQKFYRGIYVTAYVSKGAESTWEKVLDGTLTGFSIGGNIIEATNEFVKEADATVRFIKKYDLVELSLVDNPANQLANVFAIQKAADGSVTKMTGMMAETKIENIFWCETDGVARTIESETAECLNCGKPMVNIGWVENGEQKEEKVREIVAKFLSRSKDSDAVNDANGEGGVDVSKFSKSNGDNDNEQVAGVDEGRDVEPNQGDGDVPPADKNVDGAEGAEQADDGNVRHTSDQSVKDGEVVAGVDEGGEADEELSKKLDALFTAVTKSLENHDETLKTVANLEKKVDGLATTLEEKTSEFSEIKEKLTGIGTELATAKGTVEDVQKSLTEINEAGAMKKSADGEPSVEKKQKENPWGGAFSVNNLVR